LSGAEGAAIGSAAVHNSFNNHSLYGEEWYHANPGVWAPAQWSGGNAWTATNWGSVAGYVGAGAAPQWYDYGTNVQSENGTVTVNGQPAGTEEDFSQQASDLAQSGSDAPSQPADEWMPLGVFAMVRNEQQHPHMIFQFAINKDGILRGNFTEETTEHTQPISGAADPQTQRAAWTVGNNKNVVMEAGLSNLAEGEAPALIHKNGKTDHWLLVRLEQPADQDGGDSTTAIPNISQ
jgi:hypothetical protein